MAAGDLTTLANVKDWLGIPSTDTTKDARLARLITSSSTRITGWLRRGVISASYSEVISGLGNDRLALRNFPVTAIASLTIDGRAIAAATQAAGSPPSGGYVIANIGSPIVTAAFINLYGDAFCRGRENVAVTYTAGYASVPPEIEQAAIEMVQTIVNRQNIDQNVTSESISGVGSVSYRGGGPDAEDTLMMGLNGGALIPYQRKTGF